MVNTPNFNIIPPLCLFAAACLMLYTSAAGARDLYGSYHQPDLDFSVIADRAQHALNDSRDKTSIVTDITRIGVIAYNVPPDTLLHWGMQAGYASFHQDPHNLVPPLDFNGTYIGLSARVVAYETQNFSLTWTTSYSYMRLSTNVVAQKIALNWNQMDTMLQLGGYLSKHYEIIMGVGYGRVENKQTESGTVDEAHNLTNPEKIGYELSLSYHIHKHDYVALHLKSGFAKGIGVQFQGTF